MPKLGVHIPTAIEALERMSQGLPAFDVAAVTRTQRDRRRLALTWLQVNGYVRKTDTGERGSPGRRPANFTPELRLPRVTEAGRRYLQSVVTDAGRDLLGSPNRHVEIARVPVPKGLQIKCYAGDSNVREDN